MQEYPPPLNNLLVDEEVTSRNQKVSECSNIELKFEIRDTPGA
jgi:hypothetical protein